MPESRAVFSWKPSGRAPAPALICRELLQSPLCELCALGLSNASYVGAVSVLEKKIILILPMVFL